MGLIEAIGAVLAAIAAAFWFGRRSQRKDTDAKQAREYRDERKKIDDEISGIGGSDADRISKLRDIADRRSKR